MRSAAVAFVASALVMCSLGLLRGGVAGTYVRAADRNHDGQPDLWCYYDAQHRPVRIELDTNFDGRPDEIEYFRDGHLVERDLDRNFDQQIDLVETFGAGETPVRTVADVDFDGRADLLVLFRDGQPVLTEWRNDGPPPVARAVRAQATTTLRASDPDALRPLADPFLGDTVWTARAISQPFGTAVAVPSVATLVAVPAELTPTALARRRQPRPRGPTTRRFLTCQLRGPPALLHV